VVGEEARKVRRELSLIAYESAIYLSLVMIVSEVSESANVPFSKVYDVLNSLDRKG
jgi:sugar-specific transcriptional regulator TrmB